MTTHPSYQCAQSLRDAHHAAIQAMTKRQLVAYSDYVSKYLERLPMIRAAEAIKTAAVILDCDNDYEGVL